MMIIRNKINLDNDKWLKGEMENNGAPSVQSAGAM